MEWGLKSCCMGTVMGSSVKRELIQPIMGPFVSHSALQGLQGGLKGHWGLLMAWGHLCQMGPQGDQEPEFEFSLL